MSEDNHHGHRLSLVIRGYANCIVAIGNISPDDWSEIGAGDMSDTANISMVVDCTMFLAEADQLHPDGAAGIDAFQSFALLGWSFALSRLGLAPDFELCFGAAFGRQLTQLADRYDRIDIGINDGKRIVFRN